jgi:hypothetical protein
MAESNMEIINLDGKKSVAIGKNQDKQLCSDYPSET